jgi:hypothetical protein
MNGIHGQQGRREILGTAQYEPSISLAPFGQASMGPPLTACGIIVFYVLRVDLQQTSHVSDA